MYVDSIVLFLSCANAAGHVSKNSAASPFIRLLRLASPYCRRKRLGSCSIFRQLSSRHLQVPCIYIYMSLHPMRTLLVRLTHPPSTSYPTSSLRTSLLHIYLEVLHMPPQESYFRSLQTPDVFNIRIPGFWARNMGFTWVSGPLLATQLQILCLPVPELSLQQ